MIRDNKILFYLYQPYKWLVYIPFLALSTLLFGAIAVLLAFVANEKIASYVGGKIWAKLNAYMTPMFVRVIGNNNIKKNQSYVIVANHQSQFDIFALYGWLKVDFKWVLKQELRKVPGLGIGCEKVGHIFIDRSNHEAAIASLKRARDKIVNGTSVIFFPEGKRRDDGTLGEFKKGAFIMALDLGLPILPVAIAGTSAILPNNTMALFPGRAELRILEPVEVSGFSYETVSELMSAVRDRLEKGLS